MLFIKSFVKTVIIFVQTRIFKRNLPQTKTIGGRRLIKDLDETNEYIYKKLKSDDPFMVCRYGGCENDIIASYYIHNKLRIPVSKTKFGYFCNNAGFFPSNINLVGQYVKLMEEAARSVDMLAIWNWMLEDFIVDKNIRSDAVLTYLGNIEPWFAKLPWSKGLENKKVLVVHPFAQTIENQYKKHELLFANKDILPKFELQVYQAVQSIAGNQPEGFDTWFDALEKMKQDIVKLNFDVAIIGCGAYGFVLAHYVKQINKQAIHLAGATQLLFGIRGSRWEELDTFKNIFNNKYWVRPSEDEKPKKCDTIEGSCYW